MRLFRTFEIKRGTKYGFYLVYGTCYPPGSKSVALQLGVHLILLYFIKIGILSAETFFLFWWVVGGGWMPTFWFFKSFHIDMVYTLGVSVYI